MQHIKAVPAIFDHAGIFGNLTGQSHNRLAISTAERAHAQDQHWPFGLFHRLGKFMFASGQLFKNRDICAQMVNRIG